MSITIQDILGAAGELLDNMLYSVEQKNYVAAQGCSEKALVLLDLVLRLHGEGDQASKSVPWIGALGIARSTLQILKPDIEQRLEVSKRDRQRRKVGEGDSSSSSSSTSASASSAEEAQHNPPSPQLSACCSLPRFADIIGSLHAKTALHEQVILPLTLPKSLRERFVRWLQSARLETLITSKTTQLSQHPRNLPGNLSPSPLRLLSGIRAGSGNVLLYGPPGTGKTMLAQAAARESGAKFFPVRPSDILSKWQGESEGKLRAVFEAARAARRSIIFFDEFDSIATSRGGSDDGAQARRLLSELLLLMTQNKHIALEESKARQHRQQQLLLHDQQEQQEQPYQEEFFDDAATTTVGHDQVQTFEGPVVGPSGNYTPPSGVGATLSGGKRSVWSSISSSGGSARGTDIRAELYEEAGSSTQPTAQASHDESDLGAGIVVLAATNRINDLDDAVIRRFSSRVYVGLPDADSRLLLVKKYLAGIEYTLNDGDLSNLVAQTGEWSGADIEFLVREAAMVSQMCSPLPAHRLLFNYICLLSNALIARSLRQGPLRREISRLDASGKGLTNLDGCAVGPVTVDDFALASERLLQVDEDA